MGKTARWPALLLGVVLFTLAQFGTALAGSSGQQIVIYEDNPVSSVCINGLNQAQIPTYQCFETPAAQYGRTFLLGWWWRGNVTIETYNPSWVTNRYCTVPTYQSSSDWWTCSS